MENKKIETKNQPKKNPQKRQQILVAVFGVMLILAAAIIVWTNFRDSSLPITKYYSASQQKQNSLITAEMRQFGIKIDKIEVLSPVIKGVDGKSRAAYNEALQSGVAHYKDTALPGGGSNIFIFGHSSSALGSGPYSEIFARLNDLEENDKITVFYQEKEFNYKIFEKSIVEKNEVSVLEPTDQEQLTLMTCWPIGTDLKRLIIKSSLEK